MTDQSTITDPASAGGSLFAAMKGAVRAEWDGAQTAQKLLYAAGGLLIASAIFHLGVLLVTGGGLAGATSWRKPILFAESFGLTAISIAWVLGRLRIGRLASWLIAVSLAVSVTGEVAWVTVQQWRGVPSHFNFTTPLDQVLFSVAGTLVQVVVLILAVVAVLAIFRLEGARSIKWSIRAGLLLLLVSQAIGILTILNGLQRVFDPVTGAYLVENLDRASVYGAAGSMKVPHAISLHAIQILPALAWLLQFASMPESRRVRLVALASLGYTGLIGVAVVQTLDGRSMLDLGLLTAVALAASGALVAACFGYSLQQLARLPRTSELTSVG